MKRIIWLIFFIFRSGFSVDLCVFSYNRPIQLYAFLESLEKKSTGLDKIFIIYRASNQGFYENFQSVFDRFSYAHPVFQDESRAEVQFQDLILKYILDFAHASSPYICFSVDDIIVKSFIDFSHIEKSLEKSNAYAFFLRLGLNITRCYMTNKYSGLPQNIKKIGFNLFEFSFQEGLEDWNYPNNLDMTVYRKKDVIESLVCLKYSNPNDLERKWSKIAAKNKYGLCYESSKIVNVPLNLVNNSSNRNMKFLDVDELNDLFKQGLKIDIKPFENLKNSAPHMEVVPVFVPR